LDRIIFPNGLEKIFQIRFPNGEKINDFDYVQCEDCKKIIIVGTLFDLHLKWATMVGSNYICEPQNVADFLHRECPVCNSICRLQRIEKDAIGCTGGGFMPNASETMKLYVNGEEISEMAKSGEVIATIVGPGEIVEFKSRTLKNADGTPTVEKKIQICIDLGEGEERFWTPNTTSMRSLIAKYGQATEDWAGQKVKLEATKQNVSGQMKLVVYGTPSQ
jgi:hypothetical protein